MVIKSKITKANALEWVQTLKFECYNDLFKKKLTTD